jgi:hypothetical protein
MASSPKSQLANQTHSGLLKTLPPGDEDPTLNFIFRLFTIWRLLSTTLEK